MKKNAVDLNNQEGNRTAKNEAVKKMLETGESWSSMWMKFGQIKYPYDDNFMNVSEYARTHKIKKLGGINNERRETNS